MLQESKQMGWFLRLSSVSSFYPITNATNFFLSPNRDFYTMMELQLVKEHDNSTKGSKTRKNIRDRMDPFAFSDEHLLKY